jgi:cellulose synthase/poly-beta-1,6-N-acetylglucosamine synthase-like glycosyltransferase
MLETLLMVIFWASAAVVVYVYAGYPLLVALLSRWFPATPAATGDSRPRVSLLISAYNESAVIAQKLQNSLQLDYPRERIEILVVSDCSDDGTDEIVKGFESLGVRLVRQPERLGKSAGLNLGVREATGEILVFSDANAIYQKDALAKLVAYFSDPRIGYVVGNARYAQHGSQVPSAECEGLYWKLETWLKSKESQFSSVVGGDGAIYAIRRELFSPLRPTDINDLLNPLQIISKGFRGVYEPAAICYEEAGDSFDKEYRRKVRIVSRSLNAVYRAPRVLFPWVQPRHWLALVSHKLLRWFVPLFLILIAASSLFLFHRPLYRWIVFLQAGFYILALGGRLVGVRRFSIRALYIPYYFCLVNLASMFGVIQFFRGSLTATWQTIREEIPAKHEVPARLAERKP